MMAHVSDSGLNIRTMCGAMISWWQEQLREEYSEYSLSSINISGSAWYILIHGVAVSHDVIDQLFYLFIFRGTPEYIRSDNGPEFTAKAVRNWLNNLEVTTLFIEPGSPWENGYIESFNGKLRDELLDREIFTTLTEAKILIEEWRKEYNQVRPHSALDYRPPAPEVIIPLTLT